MPPTAEIPGADNAAPEEADVALGNTPAEALAADSNAALVAEAKISARFASSSIGSSIEQAVAFFFQQAPDICQNGKMLRCHMTGAHALVYTLIILRDKAANPGRHYVIVVPDKERGQDALDCMQSMGLNAVLLEEAQQQVGFEVFVVCMADVEFVMQRDTPFRIKVVEEIAPKDMDEDYQANLKVVKRSVIADLVVHFTPTSSQAAKGSAKDSGGAKDEQFGSGETPKTAFEEAGDSFLRTLRALSNPYEMVWKAVLRPPRSEYNLSELGANPFLYSNKIYEREDFELNSRQGHKLACSHYYRYGVKDRRRCVVYLHGNCSSRVEALYTLPSLLSRGLTVVAFDFAGSGKSGGDYTTLGYYEEQDIEVVVEHLRSKGSVSIGLWGRSMGGVAAVLRAAQDHSLHACVVDSAFCDFGSVVEDFAGSRLMLPNFVVKDIKRVMTREAKQRTGFDPLELNPLKRAPLATCPALIGFATDDTFILPHHSMSLHNAWGGDRQFLRFDGGHGGKRPKWFLEQASDFLLEHLNRPTTAGENAPVPSGRRQFVV